MKEYSIHHAYGRHLTFAERQTLARDFNRLVVAGAKISMRKFAQNHGLHHETWRREYARGATGMAVRDSHDRRRRLWCEYDPMRAQDAVNVAAEAKGPPMLVTNFMNKEFSRLVKTGHRSPFDAVCLLRKKFPDRKIPCTRTWYNHIAHGDIGVKYGETPYHPDRDRPKRQRPHPAKTVPGRLQVADRPKAANERSEPGHWEMDTIVSCIGGRGGLLVLIDRMTRKYLVEKIGRLSRRAVNRAIARLVKNGSLASPKSITTDNGCEFLSPKTIRKITGCKVYYTRAYASWEKGSVENANRMVRRWYPKGTDFSKCSRAEIARLENTINSIHRLSLGGMSATEFDIAAKAA